MSPALRPPLRRAGQTGPGESIRATIPLLLPPGLPQMEAGGYPAPRFPCPLPLQLGFPIHLCWDQRAAAGTLVPSAVGGCRRVYLTIKSSFHLLQQLRVLGGAGAGGEGDQDRCGGRLRGWGRVGGVTPRGRGAGVTCLHGHRPNEGSEVWGRTQQGWWRRLRAKGIPCLPRASTPSFRVPPHAGVSRTPGTGTPRDASAADRGARKGCWDS